MKKEEFNKVWKDTTKKRILNQYYYDYIYMKELERDMKILWNALWYNDTELTSKENEIFDKYYDKYHKK